MTLRIALLTHSVNPRGGVVHTLELARALHEAGHDVTVFAPALAGQRLFREVPHAVELITVGAGHGLVDMVSSRIDAYVQHLLPRVANAGGQPRFDVWHAQDSISGNALATLVDAGLIDGFVRTVHHLDHFDDLRLAHWQRRAFEQARQVLCVSPLWQRTLQQAHGIHAALVANGVDLQRFRPEPDAHDDALARRFALRPGAPLWLAVGGVEERKNTKRILQAFVLHRQQHPGAQLVIAGGASLLDHDRYQAEFRTLLGTLQAPVVLTGALPDADMPALFRLADGLLMPSLREGFGLVVLEALACHTPVVVSNEAPFTEYLGADDAEFAHPLHSADIADAMQRTLERSRTRPMRSTPAVCRRHSWAASAARHVELYCAMPVARPVASHANA